MGAHQMGWMDEWEAAHAWEGTTQVQATSEDHDMVACRRGRAIQSAIINSSEKKHWHRRVSEFSSAKEKQTLTRWHAPAVVPSSQPSSTSKKKMDRDTVMPPGPSVTPSGQLALCMPFRRRNDAKPLPSVSSRENRCVHTVSKCLRPLPMSVRTSFAHL